MLNTEAKSKIIEQLVNYGFSIRSFINVVSLEESYPNYNIFTIFEGQEVTLKLMSCVLDKSYYPLGMKLEPDGKNRDEIVNFSISVKTDDLHIFNNFVRNKYLEQELIEVNKINNDFPFDVDYEVALFYETFCLVTGTLVYDNHHYALKSLSHYPTFTIGVYAHTPTASFYSKGKSLLKIQKNGYRIAYEYKFIPVDDMTHFRLKLFQELFLYHIEKTKFKMDVVAMDEMLLLDYDDLLAYITVQKMVDI
jgi:hypothetical protein